jgi:uncharacterized metal-binding protein YceD (DUF177 family)
MALTINLSQLIDSPVELSGELTVEELELGSVEAAVSAKKPTVYALSISRKEQSLSIEGTVSSEIECRCVRCLTNYSHPIEFEDYKVSVALEGEDAASIINDSVDLTPYIRDDIVLSFPPHPACGKENCKLPIGLNESASNGAEPFEIESSSTDWSELDNLKL